MTSKSALADWIRNRLCKSRNQPSTRIADPVLLDACILEDRVMYDANPVTDAMTGVNDNVDSLLSQTSFLPQDSIPTSQEVLPKDRVPSATDISGIGLCR
jgi:hypothetical protein